MTLWFVLALMTAAAIFAVLWPLARRAPARVAAAMSRSIATSSTKSSATAPTGLIGEREAEAARVEVSRRLLAAADAARRRRPRGAAWRRRAAALAALVLLPLGAAALYLALGSPQLPGQPQAARRDAPAEQRSIEDAGRAGSRRISKPIPRTAAAGRCVGPVYMRLGRFDDAVKARRNVLRLLGANAAREADLGEALAGAANGVVTAEAKAAFERALQLDADGFPCALLPRACGRAGRPPQGGRRDLARVAGGGAGGCALGRLVRESLARVDAERVPPPKGPSADDVAAASELSPEQRAEMVRGMVERLAERLKREGSDVEGWLRLVRAYMVLGDRDKAAHAADDARRALAGEPDKLRRVEELVKGLGLEGLTEQHVTRKQRRLVLIGSGLGVLALAAVLVLSALQGFDRVLQFADRRGGEEHRSRHAHPARRPGQARHARRAARSSPCASR